MAPDIAPAARRRDIRIDFFRGVALIMIFMAHIPLNGWSDYLPSRFGFSDGAEVFVFCSGLTSALVYGRTFDQRGFLPGTARVALRCWQVYWAHISVFVLIAAMMVAADTLFGHDGDYVAGLNLKHFFTGDTAANLTGLMTLTYVPNLFDILPLYVVVLAMIPVVISLSWIGPIYALAYMAILWVVATNGYWQFPAEPWSDRPWYFHPFAWQLVFFAGFAFVRGWLPAPRIERHFMIAATFLVALSIPVANWPFASQTPYLKELSELCWSWADKTGLGILRIVHFGSLAYLAYGLCGNHGENLKGRIVDVIAKVGQHSLGVFLTGLVLSMTGGIILNELGYNGFTYSLVNLGGCALLIASAYLLAWVKSTPWK